MKKEYGKTIADLAHVVQAESYTTSMARLASGQADIAVAFSHIRIRNEKNWQTKLGHGYNLETDGHHRSDG